jgi:hypothetical protein
MVRSTESPQDPSDIIQAVGLSSGWVITHADEAENGLLRQANGWAKERLALSSGSNSDSHQYQDSDIASTLRVLEDCRDKVVRLFMSEAIHCRFSNPTPQSIQNVFGLKRLDRVTNSFPFDAIEAQTTSFHLLEILNNSNPKRTRGLAINDLVRLAIHSGSSMADFYPDSHVLIANLASLLIRFHQQPQTGFQLPASNLPGRSLRENWEATRKRFPRLSHQPSRLCPVPQLQRPSAMMLYGLFVLRYGQPVPIVTSDRQEIRSRVRDLFERGFTVWPSYLAEHLNDLWALSSEREITLDFYTDEVSAIAVRIGNCLLGRTPVLPQLVR